MSPSLKCVKTVSKCDKLNLDIKHAYDNLVIERTCLRGTGRILDRANSSGRVRCFVGNHDSNPIQFGKSFAKGDAGEVLPFKHLRE